jgi:predicted nucleotidyltransferase
MVKEADIADYVKELAREFSPEQVVLFGSYAYGKPTRDSDVDLLVVMNHRKRKNLHQAVDIDVRLQRSFPLDLIVRKPAELRRRIAMNDFFLKTVVEKGKVLYERRSQRMD